MNIDVREAAEEHFNRLGSGYVDIEPVVLMTPVCFDDSSAVAHRRVTHHRREASSADDLLRCLVLPTHREDVLYRLVILQGDAALEGLVRATRKVSIIRPRLEEGFREHPARCLDAAHGVDSPAT